MERRNIRCRSTRDASEIIKCTRFAARNVIMCKIAGREWNENNDCKTPKEKVK